MKNSNFLKPLGGLILAGAFFISSFALANTTQENAVSEVNVTTTQQDEMASPPSWWILASSDWVLAGGGAK